MAKNQKPAKAAAQLSSERDLKKRIDTVLRFGKIAGADETEVQIDETIDALTRFANNAIHQNVAEHGITLSIRTVVDSRTARATTNRLDEDSLRAAVQSSLQLAHSQPKIPGLLPMAGKQRYRNVNRFARETAATTPEDRARAVKKSCDLAIQNGQVAAGIFSTGQSQLVIANPRTFRRSS
jgi:predicted Zn-dependent protease